eukprot:1086368-Prymnesium_polylepis.1
MMRRVAVADATCALRCPPRSSLVPPTRLTHHTSHMYSTARGPAVSVARPPTRAPSACLVPSARNTSHITSGQPPDSWWSTTPLPVPACVRRPSPHTSHIKRTKLGELVRL